MEEEHSFPALGLFKDVTLPKSLKNIFVSYRHIEREKIPITLKNVNIYLYESELDVYVKYIYLPRTERDDDYNTYGILGELLNYIEEQNNEQIQKFVTKYEIDRNSLEILADNSAFSDLNIDNIRTTSWIGNKAMINEFNHIRRLLGLPDEMFSLVKTYISDPSPFVLHNRIRHETFTLEFNWTDEHLNEQILELLRIRENNTTIIEFSIVNAGNSTEYNIWIKSVSEVLKIKVNFNEEDEDIEPDDSFELQVNITKNVLDMIHRFNKLETIIFDTNVET